MATACPPLPLPVRTPRPSGHPAKLLSYSSSPRIELPERSVPALMLFSPGLRHKRLRSLAPLASCQSSRPVLDASLCKLRARDRFIHGQKSPNRFYQTTCQPRVVMATHSPKAPLRCASRPISAHPRHPGNPISVRFSTKLVLTIRRSHIKLRQIADNARCCVEMPRQSNRHTNTKNDDAPAA
jgi:hypothetical protein